MTEKGAMPDLSYWRANFECASCGYPIRVMILRGEPYCCGNCAKTLGLKS
jgi:hypothetical protein